MLEGSEVTARGTPSGSEGPKSIMKSGNEWTTFGRYKHSWLMINNPEGRESTKIAIHGCEAEYVDIFSFDSETDTVESIGRA